MLILFKELDKLFICAWYKSNSASVKFRLNVISSINSNDNWVMEVVVTCQCECIIDIVFKISQLGMGFLHHFQHLYAVLRLKVREMMWYHRRIIPRLIEDRAARINGNVRGFYHRWKCIEELVTVLTLCEEWKAFLGSPGSYCLFCRQGNPWSQTMLLCLLELSSLSSSWLPEAPSADFSNTNKFG